MIAAGVSEIPGFVRLSDKTEGSGQTTGRRYRKIRKITNRDFSAVNVGAVLVSGDIDDKLLCVCVCEAALLDAMSHGLVQNADKAALLQKSNMRRKGGDRHTKCLCNLLKVQSFLALDKTENFNPYLGAESLKQRQAIFKS